MRDEKWVPEFPSNPRRIVGPSSSAPAGRARGGGSVTASSPYSSDDEASSGSNITSRCSPKSVFSVVSKFSKFKNQIIRDCGFGGILEIPCISKLNLKQSAGCLVNWTTRRVVWFSAHLGGFMSTRMMLASFWASPMVRLMCRQRQLLMNN